MPSDFRQAIQAVDAACAAVTRLLDGGALQIYSGPRPRSADADPPASAIKLAELAFRAPAFQTPLAGAATAEPLTSARATANGSPAWFRAVDSDGGAVFDGSVGLEGSRADLELPVATIIAGAEVIVTSLVYSLPRGGSV